MNSLLFIPNAWYELWYQQDVSPNLTDEQKIALSQKISELTLKSAIWLDKDINYIEQFPELKPFSNTGKISGLQLCAVLSAIVKEIQRK